MYRIQCKVGYMGLLAAAETKLFSATPIWLSKACSKAQSNSNLGHVDSVGSFKSVAPEADERRAGKKKL